MTSTHDAITGPELRRLAALILAKLTPIITAAAAAIPDDNAEPGKCQQVWCPVCAVAALAAGEQHPLTTLLAEHGTALITVLAATLDPDHPDPPVTAPVPASERSSRYEHIDVTIVD